ncbi:alpha-1A adrenergic receptor-like [Hydractinia symbiolongicarpus]|uniref:alpha-1A adrenergic receptor-like n=1 Tax=Hydractinia symbiolongicarpus TaxID=13093 RepID=UPI00254CDA54|nr:alpha-1A adrenergic receptor-like [Hydractinia symbiolongicarpus]
MNAEEITSVTFLTIIMTVSVIGNSLVILATLISQNLRGFTNILIFNLSISDLLITTVSLPIRMSQYFRTDTFSALSDCKISVALTVFLFTSTNMNLLLITIDRFFGAVYPLKYRARTESRTTLVVGIFASWTISLIIGTFPFFIYGEKDSVNDTRITVCTFSTVLKSGYVIFIEIGGLTVPWLIMITMYVKIFIVIYKSRHNKIRSSTNTNIIDLSRRKRSSQSNIVVQKIKRITHEIRLSKVVFIIVAFYSVCMVPIGLIDLIETINYEPLVPITVIKVALLLAYANSAINPPIYAASSSKYRKHFYHLLCCFHIKQKRRQNRVSPANGVPLPNQHNTYRHSREVDTNLAIK